MRLIGAKIRTAIAACASLALAACAGTVPSPRAAQGPGDRPWSPSPLPQGAVSRPVVQPLPDAGSNRPPPGLEPAIHELWRTFPGRTGIAIRRIVLPLRVRAPAAGSRRQYAPIGRRHQ